ncbi:ISAs1 family transposase [Nocardia sp. 004]|uniref:ISAs1 family transposase n=1 Tax=Nocardia sp. 004 TaxID=3385978 RepID=UPI0039A07F99
MPAAILSPDSIPDTLEHHDHLTSTDPSSPPEPGLLRVLATVPDPRDPRGLRYPMVMLLAMAILATAAGMRGYTGYATWARTASADLLAELGLSKKYRPSDKTFRRVFALIDPTDLDHRLGAYFTALALTGDDSPLVAVAIDGKTLRLARRMGATAAHLVAAFTHRTRLVIGQLAIDDKTNEIPTVRTLLESMRSAVKATGSKVRLIISIDAMHTQTATARLIRRYLGWHYLLVCKDNQPSLLTRLTGMPWTHAPVVATDSIDKPAHGRIETRTFQILTAPTEIGFPYARQAIRVVRERHTVKTGLRTTEIIYAICSAPFELAKPQQIAEWLPGRPPGEIVTTRSELY